MSESWHTPMFRENIVRKLNDHITMLEMNVKTDARQMESNIYEKATSEQEYLAFIGRLIVYLKGVCVCVVSNTELRFVD